jgi:hypothetical protein
MIDHNALIIRILHKPGEQQQAPAQKIKRDAFIYLSSNTKDFAQCGTCWLFNAEKERCAILGPKFEVDDDDSCNFYLKGEHLKGMKLQALVTPKNAGFADRKVRCENCRFSSNNECRLYSMLNEKLPDVFDLDSKIEPRACCNANSPK